MDPEPFYTLENYSSIQTDGHRIYYLVAAKGLATSELRSILIDGGDESTLQSPVPNPVLIHISPDGSTLLVKTQIGPRGDTESAIWLVAADGSGSRKLGEIEAQDAAWAPDGKTIVFAKGENLYLTDLRGDSPVKLAGTPGRAFWLRWSPDGRVLRFTLVDPNKLSYSLWELRPDGKLSQLLTGWKGLVRCAAAFGPPMANISCFVTVRTAGVITGS